MRVGQTVRSNGAHFLQSAWATLSIQTRSKSRSQDLSKLKFFFFLQTKHSESHYITCNFKTQQLISSHRRVAYMWQWCEISCPNTPSSYVEFERLERVALCCPHILYPGWKLLIGKRLWLEPKARRAPSAYELQRWINKFHIHPQFFGSAVQLYRGGIFALSAKRNKSLEGGECFAFENTQHTFVLYVRYEC